MRPEMIEVIVPLKLTCDPDRKSNKLHLTIEDCCAQLFVGEQHVGRVAGCIGGAIEVAIDQPGRLPVTYTINPLDLFVAVKERVEKETLAGETSGQGDRRGSA